ncbi:protein kinase domain-containing protein [Legionella israelensis]|uniref:Serine/threonine-protein kinase PrkC n=1 Tax=Legionella israelensis TaxID=454 RepID=A0A0W0WGB2_9GAMM|nr:protein kinase [Legionella israelensis]KTD31328.1 Serine/threonine-protein kinase PrkC [Legionella israelensis]QBS09707.1 hypothetical protein E4T55_07445 [Legionella israelensis]SCY15075.1 Protein kinase domain-containing protein [Legionella israelensis DSM 19235]STX59236.1 Serine/threonine-protein kinase PrkC [Legionella israelensis]
MPNIKIDPTKLSEEHSILLGKLLSKAEKEQYFSTSNAYPVIIDEIEYQVKLKYPIYKENEKNSRILIKEIGSGGEGKVYLAETVILNEEKAIFKEDSQHQRVVKIHRPEYILTLGETIEKATENTAESKFKSIAEISAVYNPLHTKGSVVYEQLSNSKDYFYNNIMHLIAGKTLADVIKDKKKLTTAMRFAISRKLLEATKELHDRGIIHTDIKSQNIIVDLDFQTHTVKSLKIIDLDTAAMENKGVLMEKTPQYTYPKIEYDADKRGMDIYAAAISLLQVWGVPGDKVRTPEDVYETTIRFVSIQCNKFAK